MVRRKTLNPSGSRDGNGNYRNVHISLHDDELSVANMEVGEEVIVRVRDEKIILEKLSEAIP